MKNKKGLALDSVLVSLMVSSLRRTSDAVCSTLALARVWFLGTCWHLQPLKAVLKSGVVVACLDVVAVDWEVVGWVWVEVEWVCGVVC
jgi:hypothetical protein